MAVFVRSGLPGASIDNGGYSDIMIFAQLIKICDSIEKIKEYTDGYTLLNDVYTGC